MKKEKARYLNLAIPAYDALLGEFVFSGTNSSKLSDILKFDGGSWV